MPAGITIPWLARGELWQVKVRTRNDKPKYLSVTWADAERADQDGGHPLLYGADNLSGRHTALLVEGEFDAMLADQVCGDFLDLASLGSASADIPRKPQCCSFRLHGCCCSTTPTTVGARRSSDCAPSTGQRAP